MMRARGYSLIELALSMAIAGIIAAAALSTFSVVNTQIVQMRTESALEAKLQRTLAGFAADMQEIGGGAVRPWHAVFVRPGDALTKGSDSLLGVTVDHRYFGTPCPVVSYTPGSPGTITVGQVPDPFDAAVSRCCLMAGGYRGRFAAITRTGDAVIVGLDEGSVNVGACTISAETLFAPERIDNTHAFEDGTLTIVNAKWVAVDHDAHELNAYMLRYRGDAPDRPGQTPPGIAMAMQSQTRTLARDIYDLQVAMGYDKDLDGLVLEQPGGAGDEWLGNAAGETGSENWLNDERNEGPVGSGFTSTRFRMLEIGVLVGLRSKTDKGRAPKSVIDGPVYPTGAGPRCDADHSRLFLRGGRARVLLRNSGVYE